MAQFFDTPDTLGTKYTYVMLHDKDKPFVLDNENNTVVTQIRKNRLRHNPSLKEAFKLKEFTEEKTGKKFLVIGTFERHPMAQKICNDINGLVSKRLKEETGEQ